MIYHISAGNILSHPILMLFIYTGKWNDDISAEEVQDFVYLYFM